MLERLRRPDWLAEMQVILTAVLVVMAGLGLLGIIALVTGVSLVAEVPTRAVANLADSTAAGETSGLMPGVAIDRDGTVEVVVTDPDSGQVIADVLTELPTFLVAATMFILLLGVVRRARRENPFLAATVRRLRTLAVVVLVGGPVAFIVEMIATLDLASRVTTGHMATSIDLSSMALWLLVGFGFFAIAEVVNRGRAMRAELDTVI